MNGKKILFAILTLILLMIFVSKDGCCYSVSAEDWPELPSI